MTTEQLISPLADPFPPTFLPHLLPDRWQVGVSEELLSGENVLTSVEVDLDAKLCFKKGILVLTDRRLLARAAGDAAW